MCICNLIGDCHSILLVSPLIKLFNINIFYVVQPDINEMRQSSNEIFLLSLNEGPKLAM